VREAGRDEEADLDEGEDLGKEDLDVLAEAFVRFALMFAAPQ
jgi:hypothetical protein